jgi:phosphoglycerate dehydrogenase-like enzyme
MPGAQGSEFEMSFVIASQMEEVFNEKLRTLAFAPTVISVPEERPWEAANDADLLLIRPSLQWRQLKSGSRPTAWPGRLKWVYSASVGIDFYPSWVLEAPLVTCGRGVASAEIADYVMAAIYAYSKDLHAVSVHHPSEWKTTALGRIAGTTLGIVGLGAIGTEAARRALALGLRVTATRRRRLPSLLDGVELLDTLQSVVASADHLLLALPATEATRSLIDAAVLAQAKPSAHIINVARGSVLDQDALIAALDHERLGFATLDVTEPEPLPAAHPLWKHPRVRLTPHVSSNYSAVRHVLFDKITADLDRFIRGEPPSDIVDTIAGY